MEGDVQVESASENIRAQQLRRVSLGQCFLYPAGRLGIFAADVDEGLVTVDGVGSEEGAFDQLMGIPLEQLPILERAGLGLITVDDQIPRPGVWRQEAPFHAAGKSCATSPPEVGRCDFLVHRFRSHRSQRLLGGLVSVRCLVPLEGVTVLWIGLHAGRQNLHEIFSALPKCSRAGSGLAAPCDSKGPHSKLR